MKSRFSKFYAGDFKVNFNVANALVSAYISEMTNYQAMIIHITVDIYGYKFYAKMIFDISTYLDGWLLY